MSRPEAEHSLTFSHRRSERTHVLDNDIDLPSDVIEQSALDQLRPGFPNLLKINDWTLKQAD